VAKELLAVVQRNKKRFCMIIDGKLGDEEEEKQAPPG
jgi:hypothetical protein